MENDKATDIFSYFRNIIYKLIPIENNQNLVHLAITGIKKHSEFDFEQLEQIIAYVIKFSLINKISIDSVVMFVNKNFTLPSELGELCIKNSEIIIIKEIKFNGFVKKINMSTSNVYNAKKIMGFFDEIEEFEGVPYGIDIKLLSLIRKISYHPVDINDLLRPLPDDVEDLNIIFPTSELFNIYEDEDKYPMYHYWWRVNLRDLAQMFPMRIWLISNKEELMSYLNSFDNLIKTSISKAIKFIVKFQLIVEGSYEECDSRQHIDKDILEIADYFNITISDIAERIRTNYGNPNKCFFEEVRYDNEKRDDSFIESEDDE